MNDAYDAFALIHRMRARIRARMRVYGRYVEKRHKRHMPRSTPLAGLRRARQ